MYETAMNFIAESWAVTCQMAPYLIGGFLVAGILSVCIPKSWVKRHLGRRGVRPIFTASIIGVPLPLCSCSVIPVVASIRREGASRAASTSFLLSTPQTGADSIAVTYALLGTTFAIARPIIALATGIIGGLLVYLFVDRRRPKDCRCADAFEHDNPDMPCVSDIVETDSCCETDNSTTSATPETETQASDDSTCEHDDQDTAPEDELPDRQMPTCCSSALSSHRPGISEAADRNLPLAGLWRNAGTIIHYAFVTLPRDIGPALAIGIFVAAAISAIIPPGRLDVLLGKGIWSMLLVMLVSATLYICATASVPIAVGLIYAGASPGTALVLLIAGPATNIATLSVITKMLGRRTLIIYLGVVAACALGAGLLINQIMPDGVPGISGAAGHHHAAGDLGLWDHISGAALVVMLTAAIWSSVKQAVARRRKKAEACEMEHE